jgi:hypothetical protein
MTMTKHADQSPEDDDVPEVMAHSAEYEELPIQGCNVWICQNLSPE